MDTSPDMPVVTTERRGHVFLIGVNRPDKRNSYDVAVLEQLSAAYQLFDDDPDAWVGLLFAHGTDFTTGLDLAKVAAKLSSGSLFSPDEFDPWGLHGRSRTKPMVAAVQGWCITAGIELLLACDIRIAADDVRFTQMEVKRGIFPFGGATIRFTREVGWGNAMRWILTGEEFDAAEALRIGLVQEVVPTGQQFDRAFEIANQIAEQAAPLAVQAALASATTAIVEGEKAAVEKLMPSLFAVLGTEDAQEGVKSFVERREARYQGR